MVSSNRDVPWLRQQIRNINFLSDCSHEEIDGLVHSVKKIIVSGGQVVLKQGKPNDAVYISGSGSFGVWGEIPDGGQRRLESLLEGDCFGEVSVLNGTVANATVIAESNAELFSIPAEKILGLLRKNSWMVERMSTRASHRSGVQSLGYDPLPIETHKKCFWQRAVSVLDHIVNNEE